MFNQWHHIATPRLEVIEQGAVEFDRANDTAISFSPIPVAFTPTGGGEGVVAPADAFSGRYILLGHLCYFSYEVDFTNITNFGTGQFFMNLPFPTRNNMITREGNLNDASESEQYHITGLATSGSARMDLFFSDKVSSGVQDAPFRQGFPLTLTTADSFHVEGFYEADLS